MMNIHELSAADLRRAADLVEKIEALKSELNAMVSGFDHGSGLAPDIGTDHGNGLTYSKPKKKPRVMSEEGKAKLRRFAKARWARIRRNGGGSRLVKM